MTTPTTTRKRAAVSKADPTPPPTPAPVPAPPLPPLPADVTSISWWNATGAWAVTTAAWVAVLIARPFSSSTLVTVTTAVGIVTSIAPFLAAYITHGKVKAAHILASSRQ